MSSIIKDDKLAATYEYSGHVSAMAEFQTSTSVSLLDQKQSSDRSIGMTSSSPPPTDSRPRRALRSIVISLSYVLMMSSLTIWNMFFAILQGREKPDNRAYTVVQEHLRSIMPFWVASSLPNSPILLAVIYLLATLTLHRFVCRPFRAWMWRAWGDDGGDGGETSIANAGDKKANRGEGGDVDDEVEHGQKGEFKHGQEEESQDRE